jgi:leader peptidase (prepilin peptidase)/N-methyltransferase
MLILGLLARGALGFGDVKLAFLLGVFTGYLGWGQVVLAGLGSFILGGLVALVLVVTRRASRKDAIPFGPFMTTAAIVAVVAGDVFLDWYLG